MRRFGRWGKVLVKFLKVRDQNACRFEVFFNFRGMANGGLGWKRLGLAWGRRRMLVSVLKFEVF